MTAILSTESRASLPPDTGVMGTIVAGSSVELFPQQRSFLYVALDLIFSKPFHITISNWTFVNLIHVKTKVENHRTSTTGHLRITTRRIAGK
jgi:hypothetical protein